MFSFFSVFLLKFRFHFFYKSIFFFAFIYLLVYLFILSIFFIRKSFQDSSQLLMPADWNFYYPYGGATPCKVLEIMFTTPSLLSSLTFEGPPFFPLIFLFGLLLLTEKMIKIFK